MSPLNCKRSHKQNNASDTVTFPTVTVPGNTVLNTVAIGTQIPVSHESQGSVQTVTLKQLTNYLKSCNTLSYSRISQHFTEIGPPLWSSGQSSWLQIRRPGFDSRHYQKKKVVGLERGPLSLVSTTEELLDRKVAAPV
jgi:hypothetical protein